MDVFLEELEECLPPSPSAEAEVEQRELVAVIDRWLEEQAKEKRVLFLKRYWLGMGVEELAHWNQCTPQQISQKLLRLRRSLRKRLEQEGVNV